MFDSPREERATDGHGDAREWRLDAVCSARQRKR
jgi:hypothetical protein